jgi:hypothetical protein
MSVHIRDNGPQEAGARGILKERVPPLLLLSCEILQVAVVDYRGVAVVTSERGCSLTASGWLPVE